MPKHVPIEYYRDIFETIHDAMILVSPDSTILLANTAMERLSGYGRDDLVGSSCTKLDCDACELIVSESKETWCMLFETGSIRGKRCLMTRKDGTYVPVIHDASVIKDDSGRLIGALGVFKDASERRREDRRIKELSWLRDGGYGFQGIVGKTPIMKRTFQVVEQAAESDAPVIIYGESGTGKELVAGAP